MVHTPVTLGLGMHRAVTETLLDTIERSTEMPERVGQMAGVDIGQTPSRVVYEENKLELLHYEARTEEQNDVPILVVYALINRPFILDLQPGRSVIERLLDAGHDVYMINWNEPSRLDRHLTLSDYIDRYIDNCVDEVRDRSGQDSINFLGYCMGGTMSACYSALYPGKVNALGLMAAGLCFDDTAGLLERWGDDDHFDPQEVVDTYGNVPADFLDHGFALMDPIDNYVTKYVSLYDNIENEEFVENFARMERWLGEGIDLAGDAYVEFLRKFYQQNQLCSGDLEIGGRPVEVEHIDVPILQILGEYDHLVPPSASKPFNDIVGSDDVTTMEHRTGHIGLSVSGSSHENLWPAVAEWYHDVSDPAEAGDAGDDGDRTPDETPGDEDAKSDLEAIDGIGPTYADRLRAAGIEEVHDLADYDAAELADIAQTATTRATDWLEQVE